MKGQQQILKFVLIAASSVTLLIAGFFFIRWVYTEDATVTSSPVYSDYGQDTRQIERFSGNILVNIINATLPVAKVGYEGKYGMELPSFVATAYNRISKGVDFDITDPKTYFSFVFTAFSQYDESIDYSSAEGYYYL
jgi:hypothetical protein